MEPIIIPIIFNKKLESKMPMEKNVLTINVSSIKSSKKIKNLKNDLIKEFFLPKRFINISVVKEAIKLVKRTIKKEINSPINIGNIIHKINTAGGTRTLTP